MTDPLVEWHRAIAGHGFEILEFEWWPVRELPRQFTLRRDGVTVTTGASHRVITQCSHGTVILASVIISGVSTQIRSGAVVDGYGTRRDSPDHLLAEIDARIPAILRLFPQKTLTD